MWDLQDRRPVAIRRYDGWSTVRCRPSGGPPPKERHAPPRRLHPVNAGVINLRLFRAPSGGQLLATQGRDGVTHLWACPGDAAPVPSE